MKNNHSISRRKFLTKGFGVGAAVSAMMINSLTPLSRAKPDFVKHYIATKEKGCLRIGACQILNYPDVHKSTEKVLYWIEAAAKDDVDVISFPEVCLCGYAPKSYWSTADPKVFQKAEARIIEASKRYNIAVILGTVHWESKEIYNDLLVIDKGGVVRGRYSKTHLAEDWPVPGKKLPVYLVAGVNSCFIICHDVRYPELVRLPAAAGAQICYFCSHESGLDRDDKLSAYNAMPIARATENSIFCIMANAPADPKTLRGSHGNSKIIHPDGNVLIEAGYFEERLVTANIRIKDADRSIARRAVNDNTILKNWLNDGLKLVQI
jgi:omega-amidase